MESTYLGSTFQGLQTLILEFMKDFPKQISLLVHFGIEYGIEEAFESTLRSLLIGQKRFLLSSMEVSPGLYTADM